MVVISIYQFLPAHFILMQTFIKNSRLVQATAITLSLAIAILGFTMSINKAKADVDPTGCTDTGGGISLAAFRSDGVTNVSPGTVVDGELIKYKATISALGLPNCAFFGGTWSITTPDGVVHNVTPGGGIPKIGGTGVASLGSVLVDYTVNHANEIVNGNRHINATTDYSGGKSHADGNDTTNGPSLGTSKIINVIHTPVVATNIHNAAHGVITSAAIGTTVHDNATVTGETGGPATTGTVNFTLYPNTTCATTGTTQSGVALSGNIESNTTVVPNTGMSYKAHYNGDSNYTVADGPCEPLTATKLTPTVTTDIHDGAHAIVTAVSAGASVHDKALVVGSGPVPTGNVDFTFYSNSTCAQTGAVAGSAAVNGGGIADPSTVEGPLAGGSYSFKAHYVGDANYNAGDATCEPLTVNKLTPTVTTDIHSAAEAIITSAAIGSTVHDKATVGGTGPVPTGTVDFTFYSNLTCASEGSPAGAGVALVAGVAHPSSNEGPLNAGSYSFKAHYNGDGNYVAGDAACEPLTVAKATPSIATVPSAGGLTGTVLNDTATLTGGATPTGNVTFKLFAPSAPTCSGSPVYTDVDGTSPYATTGGYTSLVAGTYHWTADYAGDTNNIAISSGCVEEPVVVTAPKGHIIVDKVTLPSGDLQSFNFTTGGTGYVNFSLTDAAAPNDQTLDAGSYSVSEPAVAGWASDGGVCDGQGNTPASITLAAGQTVHCTFTNTKRGRIIVDKVTNPAGSSQSFAFTTTGTGYNGFSLTDAAAPNNQSVVPGAYTVGETPVAGWTSDGGICDNQQTPGALTVAPGQTVTCTFTNTQQMGHIIVDKVTNPSGDATSFTFTTTGTGYNGFSLTDAAAPNNQTLVAGSYSISEANSSLWTQTSAVCTDGETSVDPAHITLLAGHTVSCVFTNTKVALQYCSPGYWKNHPASWVAPYTPGTPGTLFSSLFEQVSVLWSSKGKPALVTDPTLQQGLEANGGGLNMLVRATVNALLNTAAGLNTGLTIPGIIASFNSTVPGTDAQYQALAGTFTAPENCPLN